MSDPRHFARINPDGTLAGLIEYSEPPVKLPADAVALTPEQHGQWLQHAGMRRWDASAGKLVPHHGEAPTRPIAKVVVIDRLIAAGKLRAARAALRLGVPDDKLSDAELALRDRWTAATAVSSDDVGLRGALQRAGADPDSVLAPP